MKTGISTACFYGRELNEDAVLQIGELGVKNAEIFFSCMAEYEPSFAKKIKQICGDYGIKMVSVHAMPTQFEPQLFSFHPKQYAEALDIYGRVLDAGAILEAEVYVFHGPIHLKQAKKLDIDMEFAAERVRKIADMAAERSIAFCYENVHWCWFKKPEFAKNLLKYCDNDNLFFTLDLKQAAQSGCRVSEFIDAMGERLRHVHVCDYKIDREKGIIPVAPFCGDADFEYLRRRLSEQDYKGCLMLEIYKDNYNDYADLKSIYEKVDAFFNASAEKL